MAADRPMVLDRCNRDFDMTMAALLNMWRETNKAPGKYSTATGRGNHHKHQSLESITSFVLACAVNDPKNAAELIPAIGDLKMADGGKRIRREYTYGGFSPPNALSGLSEDHTVTTKPTAPMFEDRPQLFDLLTSMAKYSVECCGSPSHLAMLEHFKLTIQVSPSIAAEIEMPPKDGWISTYSFHPLATNKREPVAKLTIPVRKVVIGFALVEMIADLYRDTLAHEAAAVAPEPQPSLTLGEGDDVPIRENENAALPGAASTRTQKPLRHGSDFHSQQYEGESEKTQSFRRGRSGPRHFDLRTRHHADPKPRSDSASCL